MLARGIKHQPHRRTVVVSGSFPTLSAEDAREVGRILGALGGVVILHNNEGAADGRMESIKAGVAANPVPPLMLVLGSEVAAVDQMLQSIGAGDTALILADHPPDVLQQIVSFSTG
jgi:predicted Rossmann-fold nucleotide-binding protein